MIASTGEWDIRVPARLLEMFPRERRRGYWFKVDRATAQLVVDALAAEYGVVPAWVDNDSPVGKYGRNNGWYREWCGPLVNHQGKMVPRGSISMWPRGHLKTVFHEFYHHLDRMTDGRYCSDDFPNQKRWARTGEPTPPTSLAWIFAEKLWDKMKELTYAVG